MPWSAKQHRLFEAVAHGWSPPARSGISIKRSDAQRMAAEGVKRASGGLAIAGYAPGGPIAPQDNTPLYALPQSNQAPGVPQMSLEQIEAMKPIAGLAGGGAPKTLVELLKALPRHERFGAMREHPMADVSKPNAMWATLKSDASPLALYGPFPDNKIRGNMAFVPRSRQRFMMFDSSKPNAEGHATELGSLAANWGPGWQPKDLIDLDIAKPMQRQGYGHETLASLLSTVKDENERFPLYDVKRSAKKYWESLGAQMKDPSRPFMQNERAVFDDDGMRDIGRSRGRNNDYYLTPGDFLDNVDKFSRGGGVRRYAGGGYASSSGAGDGDIEAGAGPDSGDPRLDIRSRVLAQINKRIQQSTSLGAAQRASMDITAPIRSLRRLTLPHLADPWSSQYLAHTPFDTQLSYGRYPTPDTQNFASGGYADGGETAGDAATGAGALALLSALRPRMMNKLSRPFARALARPTLGVEAVSKFPLSGRESDARFNIAREAAMHEYGDRPVHRLQGAWSPGEGEPMQHNPLYAQELPRTLGRVIDDREAMRYAGQMGENLEQEATPVSRFVPHLMNTPEDANAMQFSDIDNEKLRRLSEIMGSGWVSAHRPGNKAMAFPLNDDWSLEKMASRVRSQIPGSKVRYGRSDPQVDRALLSRQPLGYEDMTYGAAGARPRNEAYEALESAGLRSPDSWALRGAK